MATPKNVKKKIGEHEFLVRRIPAFEALELAGELQRVFGSAIASLAAMSAQSNDRPLDPGMLSGILMDSAEALGRNLDGKTLRYLVESLIREDSLSIRPNGKGEFMPCGVGTLEAHAELSDILEVAVLILQHNFRDFFGKVAALFGNQLMKSKGTATSQNEEQAEASEDRNPLDD